MFNSLIKSTALELRAKYKTSGTNRQVKEDTISAMKFLAKNLDGRAFTLLNKHLTELRSDVLNN